MLSFTNKTRLVATIKIASKKATNNESVLFCESGSERESFGAKLVSYSCRLYE